LEYGDGRVTKYGGEAAIFYGAREGCAPSPYNIVDNPYSLFITLQYFL
jgi:hypothetical protein